MFILFMAYLLHQRDLMDASAKNARGDVATAETDFSEDREHRVKTVIRLHRAGYWFSTTLVEARSREVLVGLKWRNEDTLDVQLDFGCKPQMELAVTVPDPDRLSLGRPRPCPERRVRKPSPPRPAARDLPVARCRAIQRAAASARAKT